MTNDYSLQDQIDAYQQLVKTFGEASDEVNGLNESVDGLKDIIKTFSGNREVIA